MDNRGVTPVVEKLLTIGIVVLFIGSVMAVLFGSAVPAYRDAVGAELGDRVVVSAAEQIESTVPPNGTVSSGQATLELPATIRGEPYEIRVDGRALVLEHSTPAIGARTRLSLPTHIQSISGSLESRGNHTVVIESAQGGVAIRVGER